MASDVDIEGLLEASLALLDASGRRFLAIAGAPGSGKSTTVERLYDRLDAARPGLTAILPMDGFHFDDAVLHAVNRRLWKGAPDTFDVGGLASVLARLRKGDETVAVPVFDRDLEISRGSARLIDTQARLILVEGNYLLLDQAPWDQLAPLFDKTVMIDVPEDVLAARLRARWVHYKLSDNEILQKLEGNDLPNGRTVRDFSRNADFVLHRQGAHIACFIGVDVGTSSARAGVFDDQGTLLGTGIHPLDMHRTDAGHAEQSSAQIWQAVCDSVRKAIALAGVAPDDISGIGFDATCSLAVIGASDGVGEPGYPERDVIVWSDHRANEQAARINAMGHAVLDYVGGRISPEMQTPKLLWLRENRPEVYHSAAYFFDLTDFLTWKASGDLARSICTVTCKWTYLAHERRWDESYFQGIGRCCHVNRRVGWQGRK